MQFTKIQSTTWVKKESEKQARLIDASPESYPIVPSIDLTACFFEDSDGNNARYETICIDNHVKNLNQEDEVSEEGGIEEGSHEEESPVQTDEEIEETSSDSEYENQEL